MPVYSPEGQAYRERVHQNGRQADPDFDGAEHLYRRYPKHSLVGGKPIPLSMQFEEYSGISVNRSKYSEPQDVLEADCCDGRQHLDCVILDILVADLPAELATRDGSGRSFRFRMAHKPLECCYAHSEIWCNEVGDVREPYQHPPKSIKNLFRAELARALAKRDILEFPLRLP